MRSIADTSGYSIDQLLEWSLEDRLIDGYERNGETVIIIRGNNARELRSREAKHYLKRMFREFRSHRGEQIHHIRAVETHAGIRKTA